MIINKDKNQPADYYDSLARTYRDSKIVYNRFEQVLEMKRITGNTDCCVIFKYKIVDIGFPRYEAPQNSLFIGFAGKTYKAKYHDCKWSVGYQFKLQEAYYDYAVTDKDFQTRWYNKNFKFDFSMNLFHTFQTPVMAIWQGNLIINPNLKAFEFQKVVDPYTALTELQNFIAGVLGTSKEIIEVADKYKIQNHGYDKYSFKHPVKLKDLT
jgi:hypothetical protein